MSGYTKLFESILESTVWLTAQPTRLVWITMLAMSDAGGVVEAAVPGLARRAGVSVEEAEEALRCFLSPDPHSRTKDHEGRRIVEVDGGWRLLNHGKYREKMSSADMRAKAAERSRRYRERHAERNVASRCVTPRDAKSRESLHSEAEAEAESEKRESERRASAPTPTPPEWERAERPLTETIKLRFEVRFTAARGNPPAWTPKAVAHVGVIAAWLGSREDRLAALDSMLTAFFADAWCTEHGYPIGALASDPAKYLAPPTVRRDVRKGFVDPAPASAFTNPTNLDDVFGPEIPAEPPKPEQFAPRRRSAT